jgi:hypothetical protein
MPRTRIVHLGIAGICLLAGCDPEASRDLATSEHEIVSGTKAAPHGWRTIFAAALVRLPGCTRTLIRPNWEISTQPCFGVDDGTGGRLETPLVRSTVSLDDATGRTFTATPDNYFIYA